jgi:hypothetical protein
MVWPVTRLPVKKIGHFSDFNWLNRLNWLNLPTYYFDNLFYLIDSGPSAIDKSKP